MRPIVGGLNTHHCATLTAVQLDIASACERAGRSLGSVTLIAASKTVPGIDLRPFIEAGQLVYGENRVQEARDKWPLLRAQNPRIELHLIGPLQSNKVREAVALFDVIHSLDRPSLCAALMRECEKQSRLPRVFIQVNTGHEPQKAGVAVDQVDEFVASCRREGFDVAGLMCIPPAMASAAVHFTILAQMAARNGLCGLSMGMSSDYALAIAHGATHVRVGTALFGAR